MDYKLQIISLIISFLYGVFFSTVTNINYNYLYKTSTPFKITFNIIFILDVVLIYLIIMYKINKGIFHNYFILMIFLGYVVSFNKIKASTKRLKLKCIIEKNEKK